MGWVLSCETGLSEVPIHFSDEKATSSHATDGEYGTDFAQSETPGVNKTAIAIGVVVFAIGLLSKAKRTCRPTRQNVCS